MASCLICSDLLLRQVRSGKPVLYCRTCRIEYENNHGFTMQPNQLHQASLQDTILDPKLAWDSEIFNPSTLAS